LKLWQWCDLLRVRIEVEVRIIRNKTKPYHVLAALVDLNASEVKYVLLYGAETAQVLLCVGRHFENHFESGASGGKKNRNHIRTSLQLGANLVQVPIV